MNLSHRFRVDVSNSPSTDLELQELRNFSRIPLPTDYVELIEQGSEIEILVDNRMYIRIWGARVCIEMNKAYSIQNCLGDSLAIGDNEGGSALVLVPSNDGIRAGIYLIDFGCLDIDEGVFIAGSLSDLLINEVGVDLLR
ncbi:MAG: SMI1/KNR4 family protein [Planctomycetaceae bacterium]|nr:SMI1/KNR4 family protein [Planctomycetaceae bacterium]